MDSVNLVSDMNFPLMNHSTCFFSLSITTIKISPLAILNPSNFVVPSQMISLSELQQQYITASASPPFMQVSFSMLFLQITPILKLGCSLVFLLMNLQQYRPVFGIGVLSGIILPAPLLDELFFVRSLFAKVQQLQFTLVAKGLKTIIFPKSESSLLSPVKYCNKSWFSLISLWLQERMRLCDSIIPFNFPASSNSFLFSSFNLTHSQNNRAFSSCNILAFVVRSQTSFLSLLSDSILLAPCLGGEDLMLCQISPCLCSLKFSSANSSILSFKISISLYFSSSANCRLITSQFSSNLFFNPSTSFSKALTLLFNFSSLLIIFSVRQIGNSTLFLPTLMLMTILSMFGMLTSPLSVVSSKNSQTLLGLGKSTLMASGMVS